MINKIKNKIKVLFCRNNINNSLEHVNSQLMDIYNKLSYLINYEVKLTNNIIKDLDKLATELSNLYMFKELIIRENDLYETYKKLSIVFNKYMDIKNLAVYETNNENLNVIIKYGDYNACNTTSDKCIAYNTKSNIDSKTKYCSHFNNNNNLFHYCMPVVLHKEVYHIIQIVYSTESEQYILQTIPYVKEYINEVTPSLETKLLIRNLYNLSITDKLTGVCNRHYLDNFKNNIQDNACCLLIDIDYFKRINDTYGHHVGDLVLIEVVNIIKQNIRKGDVIIRYGGEEFLVILNSIDTQNAIKKAEQIRKAVEQSIINADNKNINITISIGVSKIIKNDLNSAIQQADICLYKAKNTGRNQVCYPEDFDM